MPTFLRIAFVLGCAGILNEPALAFPFDGPQTQSVGGVTITLRASATIGRSQALLKDIASFEGGAFWERQQLGNLDLADLPTSGSEVVISREQITYRLLLAGIAQNRFQLEGSTFVRVSRTPSLLHPQVVTVSHQERSGPPSAEKHLDPSPVLIKRRDFVQLVIHIGNMQLTARGEALQDARAGERISVRNVDSSRVVNGRVVDRSTVEVDFERSKP
jgi:hypothetical protein